MRLEGRAVKSPSEAAPLSPEGLEIALLSQAEHWELLASLVLPAGIHFIRRLCNCLGEVSPRRMQMSVEGSIILGQIPNLQDFNNIQILFVGHAFI